MNGMKMIDLAKEPAEIKKETAEMASPAMPSSSVAEYSYGLCISLGEYELGKMGMADDLPQVGEMIHLAGMAKVTSVSESERIDKDGTKTKCCRVELQITHLASEDEDAEVRPMKSSEARSKSRYEHPDEEAA